jgi:hypothetical protein
VGSASEHVSDGAREQSVTSRRVEEIADGCLGSTQRADMSPFVLAAGSKGKARVRERAASGRTFESIGDEWIPGVVIGRITVRDYRVRTATSYAPEFGPMPADDIGEVEWQMWIDELSREGLTRSRISTHVAVASAIYA